MSHPPLSAFTFWSQEVTLVENPNTDSKEMTMDDKQEAGFIQTGAGRQKATSRKVPH